jgi:type VI secretion system protein ImpC
VVGAYTFGTDDQDVALLARVGAAARSAGAPFVAGAAPGLVGAERLQGMPEVSEWREVGSTFWETLRRRPEAASVGLVAPRLLLRLPYGKDTDECETLAFEEMAGVPEHESYLWGNPALAVALVLARAFEADGWGMRPERYFDVDGLPFHVARVGGESVATPVAEALLTERAAGRMLERGIIPLLSFKESDRARLARLQSIANPAAPLAGPWS